MLDLIRVRCWTGFELFGNDARTIICLIQRQMPSFWVKGSSILLTLCWVNQYTEKKTTKNKLHSGFVSLRSVWRISSCTQIVHHKRVVVKSEIKFLLYRGSCSVSCQIPLSFFVSALGTDVVSIVVMVRVKVITEPNPGIVNMRVAELTPGKPSMPLSVCRPDWSEAIVLSCVSKDWDVQEDRESIRLVLAVTKADISVLAC